MPIYLSDIIKISFIDIIEKWRVVIFTKIISINLHSPRIRGGTQNWTLRNYPGFNPCNPNVAFRKRIFRSIEVDWLNPGQDSVSHILSWRQSVGRVTFRFGCIGNCAIRNAESFSDEWSSESESKWNGKHAGLFCLPSRIYAARIILIDSSWRRRDGWSSRVLSQRVKLTLCDIRALPSPTTVVIVQLQFAKLSASRRLFRRELLGTSTQLASKGRPVNP